ncbi:DUF4440 domain-containing protein [Erythrobacter sp.]|jgi:hypothetical protein|uniref:DUF4440 domain-containing protein n=1 Tax=Erythrobacter sp. TaxID=1042 RepID=UPI002EB70DE7|nr:DUF4440 domain-containing protein [Erythrobacter sp.]
MADLDAEFLARENALMKAWMHADVSALKTQIARGGLILVGSTPPVLLDRPSLVAAAEGGLRLTGFRFDQTTARQYDANVWFSGDVQLELDVGGREWTGHFLITDLWRKGRLRRRWQLVERSLAPLRGDGSFSARLRALQLWR